MNYVIASKNPNPVPALLRYVSGFSFQHQIVQTTEYVSRAKKFRTFSAAQRWLIARSDCGYGLSSTDYHVVEAS